MAGYGRKPYNGHSEYSYEGRRRPRMGSGMAEQAATSMEKVQRKKRKKMGSVMDMIRESR